MSLKSFGSGDETSVKPCTRGQLRKYWFYLLYDFLRLTPSLYFPSLVFASFPSSSSFFFNQWRQLTHLSIQACSSDPSWRWLHFWVIEISLFPRLELIPVIYTRRDKWETMKNSSSPLSRLSKSILINAKIFRFFKNTRATRSWKQ